ncbi:SDR family NAD(P)-dependent oxidoreductase [Aspergillus fijiensis CBS 313.89]|uniref:NAD(P)-binding protein n=1 Tax=Aspergillus fijiensis CBS 313.89 TaxID=1448319 RepID=A0A8G1RRL2_9EURO|nr:NAD(P)-binding protein [Aspergillus fijiensis CBS 313.89]RAK75441.1 NAD(P)-binding protein [Aspergillus fijiensis CBS 313.89]
MDVPGYAMITGAASGIGRACAVAFADEGAAGLALLDLSYEALCGVKAEIESHRASKVDPKNLRIFVVDVTDEDQVNSTVLAVAKDFGRIDYLVNAAGIAMKHAGGAAFVDTNDWKRIIDVNLHGSFYMLRAACKVMLNQEPITSTIDGRPLSRGSIVNFSSIQGVVGLPMSTAYTTSKHGILGLTRTASEDYAKDGIRINAICPGYTETPLTMQPDVLKVMREKVATSVPIQRMAKGKEIADGVLYLAGGRSSFVTGTPLFVDGGYTQQ